VVVGRLLPQAHPTNHLHRLSRASRTSDASKTLVERIRLHSSNIGLRLILYSSRIRERESLTRSKPETDTNEVAIRRSASHAFTSSNPRDTAERKKLNTGHKYLRLNYFFALKVLPVNALAMLPGRCCEAATSDLIPSTKRYEPLAAGDMNMSAPLKPALILLHALERFSISIMLPS